MRAIITTILLLVFTQLNAQNMKQPKDVVLQLFKATDEKKWNVVEETFAKNVNLDYSSMTGNPAQILKPIEIIDAWKTVLPGFKTTHHQIGNITETINEDKASVFGYGTATHFLEDDKGNIWTIVGTYDFDLVKVDKSWKISTMKFNFKYQTGNTSLPRKAMNMVSGVVESQSTSAKNINSVKEFFKALENENAKKASDLFAELGKHINPYHSNIFPKGANGKAEILSYWDAVFPNFDGMTFKIEEIYAMENANMVYVKYSGNIQLKNNSGVYSNNYYSTFKFNKEGKITEYVEIFNPIIAAKGFGLLDKIK